MDLLISIICLLEAILQTSMGQGITSKVAASGKVIWSDPIYCTDPGFGATGPVGYTARRDRSCCYQMHTRPYCCLRIDSSRYGTCTCSGLTTCGVIYPYLPIIYPVPYPTTAAATTATTTTTTTPQPLTTTTAAATTTPTATTVSTGTTTGSLCDLGYRALNGVPVDDCDFPGIANITLLGGTSVTCNAIYTTASVYGVYKLTFLTTEECKDRTEELSDLFDMELMIGALRVPTAPGVVFNPISAENGLAFLDPLPTYANLFNYLGPCQAPACSFDIDTMTGQVNFFDCQLVSYGVTNSATLASEGLTAVAVRMVTTGCEDLTDLPGVNKLCFRSMDNENILCSGDGGAPVYCKAPDNDEWILYGVTAVTDQVCDASPDVFVIPVPTA